MKEIGHQKLVDSLLFFNERDRQYSAKLIETNKQSVSGNDAAIGIYYSEQLPAYQEYLRKLHEAIQIIMVEFSVRTKNADQDTRTKSIVIIGWMGACISIMITGLIAISWLDIKWVRKEKETIKLREEEQIRQFKLSLRAQEQDRNNLGKELHDNVNQLLGMAQMNLSIAEKDHDSHREVLPLAKRLVGEAIEEIRMLSRSLVNPVSKDFSIKESITQLVQSINQASPDIAINLFIEESGDDKYLSPEIKVNVYRIAQEQLNNIFKHAEATEINIYLTYDVGELKLTVEDNGRGFDLSSQRRGIGVNNIYNRAQAFEGEAVFDTAPGKGCVLNVVFPIK